MIKLCYALFESLWRRAFGSGIFNRAILHVVNIAATLAALRYIDISWIRCLTASAIFEFLFWSIGHGGAFDIGRAGYPDEETIKRYKRFFWNKWCEYIIPKKHWYGEEYDFLWMLFRYTLPAILVAVAIGRVYFSFAGLAVTLIYSICWSFYDKGKTNRPTEWAEVFSGLITGFLLLC